MQNLSLTGCEAIIGSSLVEHIPHPLRHACKRLTLRKLTCSWYEGAWIRQLSWGDLSH